jgi:hypothetical protein
VLCTFLQKTRTTDIWSELSAVLLEEPHVLEKIVAGDVTWVFQYKPEMMHQSFQWKVPTSQRLTKV